MKMTCCFSCSRPAQMVHLDSFFTANFTLRERLPVTDSDAVHCPNSRRPCMVGKTPCRHLSSLRTSRNFFNGTRRSKPLRPRSLPVDGKLQLPPVPWHVVVHTHAAVLVTFQYISSFFLQSLGRYCSCIGAIMTSFIFAHSQAFLQMGS